MASHFPHSKLTPKEIAAIVYHNIFEYPLTITELNKWKYGKRYTNKDIKIEESKGYFYIKGAKKNVLLRNKREKLSLNKLRIAKRSVRLLSFIPTIKAVAVSGSLAMRNAKAGSDIDLMVITSPGWLWLSRFISIILLFVAGYGVRRPNDTREKDRLCLNVWLSGPLTWQKSKRNIYTAHEIAQLVPLLSKDYYFESFLKKNKWILNFWPNSTVINAKTVNVEKHKNYFIDGLFFYLQYQYMKGKITKEIIRRDLALFHPYDWSNKVIKTFNK